MAAWAESKRIIVDLHGLDINPFMIEQAQAQSKTSPGIHYKAIDVFSTEFSTLHFDIITMNSFCHHLNNSEMIKALVQLSRQARVAIIINDLQRHRISYYAIKWLAKCLNFSKLAQHDGPLSVLRAFRKQELVNILKQANIHHYSISWRLLFRWQVIVWL
ncbi:MAG: SAM-dependent methyltransferase [Gammaproteobacteria bacterium]|nr:SAM-dependent methyltransferase [Gammaproteobacteria bacterium]